MDELVYTRISQKKNKERKPEASMPHNQIDLYIIISREVFLIFMTF